eukprot:11434345-Heterocapsa_arctica.AAC.1
MHFSSLSNFHNVVPGFKLLWGELIGLWNREHAHFLDHGIADVCGSDWPMSGYLGVKEHFHL